MIKIGILIGLLSLTTVMADDCMEKLTLGYNKDSHTFQISTDQLDRNFELNVKAAEELVGSLLRKLNCEETISFKYEKCANIVPTRNDSRVCYLEAHKYGYFIINVDYLDTANITFNRYD